MFTLSPQIYLEYLDEHKTRDKAKISIRNIWMWIKWETKFQNSHGTFQSTLTHSALTDQVLVIGWCRVYLFCFFTSSERHIGFYLSFLSSFERNIGGPGACYKVLAELSSGFADTGPPRGVSTGGKQIAPRYTNIHLYFVFAISCRNKYKYKWKHQNS